MTAEAEPPSPPGAEEHGTRAARLITSQDVFCRPLPPGLLVLEVAALPG